MIIPQNKLVKALVLLVIIIPSIVLYGWIIGSPYLTRVLPSLTPMNPVSALCFILLAFSLILQVWEKSIEHTRMARFIGFLVMLMGIMMLAKYSIGLDFGIDRIFFESSLGINRMAPNTAIDFVLLGAAILLYDWKIKKFRPGQVLVGISFLFSANALIGYFYNLINLYVNN